MLEINQNSSVSFNEEWLEQLRALPYNRYGEFIRLEIYPEFTDQEQKLWNKTTISNREFHAVIEGESC